MEKPEPLSFALLGYGNRGGDVYADYLLRHPEAGRLVAVAEPRPERLALAAKRHRLSPEQCFADPAQLLSDPRRADVLIVATPDRHHAEQAIRGLELGYHLLLEKPIATTPTDLERVAAAATARPELDVTVAHVLRYAPLMRRVKRALDEGELGTLIDVVHQEDIGAYHYAHSYVRGNWRREADSAPMLLAKACHDLDLLLWWVGRPVRRIASIGALAHFRPEHAPTGATERCLDCPVEDCPFDARRIYLERFGGGPGWPNSVLSSDPSPTTIAAALREGDYGRCVYLGENDVADHQSVLLEFDGGVRATLVASAFRAETDRRLRFGGSHAELIGELRRGELLRIDHGSGLRQPLGLGIDDPTAASDSHGGGDDALMADVCARAAARLAAERGALPPAAALRAPSPTALGDALQSHRLAFAAERARREGRTLELDAAGRVIER